MASTDGVTVGRRIAAARIRAGLTQAELALRVSLDRSALAKIENGVRRVSALELARIANTVGERIEWFVTETPAAIVSHRNVSEPGASCSVIDRTAERVAWHVDFVVRHGLDLVSRDPMTKPRNIAEAEKCAVTARGLLGLDLTEPCFEMSRRLADVGLLTFSFDLGENAADAASMHLERGGVAILNGHLHVGRRRLAAAHELGHFLFADEYTVDWTIGESEEDAVWEARLDRFARAILLPAPALERTWRELRSRGDDLRTASVRTASGFRVDMSTLSRRLYELGLVSSDDARRIRQTRTRRADIVEFDLVVNEIELSAPHLPRMYEEAVLRLYRQETISSARAEDLLFDTWTEDDLPELPELPESATWNFV